MRKSIFFYLLIIFNSPLPAQLVNFRDSLTSANPIEKNSSLSLEEKIQIHKEFTLVAVEQNNLKEELYGNLYLFLDYVRAENFTTAAEYILEAENIAKESGNLGWQGWVKYRSGLLYIRLDKKEKAKEVYAESIKICGQASDSLCLAESLEQYASMLTVLEQYPEAEKNFELAIPLIRKHGKNKNLQTALGNYAMLVSISGNPRKAIPLHEEVIAMHMEGKNFRSAGKGMNNLADAYRRLKEYDTAIQKYEETIKFNRENDFLQNIVTNYNGLELCYKGIKDYKTAGEYLEKSKALNDSIISIETFEKIAALDAEKKLERTKTELNKTENELSRTQYNYQKIFIFLVILSLLFVAGIFVWRKNTTETNAKIEENKKRLSDLTNLLLKKNENILRLESKAEEIDKKIENKEIDENLFNQRFLTEEDYSKFKLLFEKSYPGLLSKVRSKFSTMTVAEERLFLLLKLNMTGREIATILGISTDSVKKTRYRLRKRLNLEKGKSLENFILNF